VCCEGRSLSLDINRDEVIELGAFVKYLMESINSE